MAHLWSGRFAGDPDARALRVRRVVSLRSPPVRRRRHGQPARGRRRWRAPACSRPTDAAAIDGGLRADPREGLAIRLRRESRRRGRPCVRRARAGRAHRRRRPAAAHRPIAQRAGRRRSPALPEAPHSRDPAARSPASVEALRRVWRTRAGGALMPSYTHLRARSPCSSRISCCRTCAALRRDIERLAAVLREADELPLGSGAIAGTSYAIDVHGARRARSASRAIARNSIDVSGDRDFVASFLHAAVARHGASEPASPRTSSSSRPRSSGSSSSPTRRRPAAA